MVTMEQCLRELADGLVVVDADGSYDAEATAAGGRTCILQGRG